MSNLTQPETSSQLSLTALIGSEDRGVQPARGVSDPNPNSAAIPRPNSQAELPPMMQHYLKLKKEYPEHLLLYQVGDFYEIFFDDAKTAAEILSIRLTSRNREDALPIAMCGVPVHAIDNYLPRLLQAGQSCVIVSQIEESSGGTGASSAGAGAKGLGDKRAVRREITRIVTPGVRYEGDGLSERAHNYLAAAAIGSSGSGGIVYVDVSTGHLRVQECENLEELSDVIGRIRPSELILPSTFAGVRVERGKGWYREIKRVVQNSSCHLVHRPFDLSDAGAIGGRIKGSLFGASSRGDSVLNDLGPETKGIVQVLLDYVAEVSFGKPPRISSVVCERPGSTLTIDSATRRNLELLETTLEGDTRNSLITRIDHTKTAMGYRLLSEWILSPVRDRKEIERRLDAVEELFNGGHDRSEIASVLVGVRDLERILSRISTLRANPCDIKSLADSVLELPKIAAIIGRCASPMIAGIASEFDPLVDVTERIHSALVDDPPLKPTEGGIFKAGVNPEVDRLRNIHERGGAWLAEYEVQERARTGISGLKVKYNNVNGYFIEVTKTHAQRVPSDYERKQTLVNAERFVTAELKRFEQEALSAKAKLCEIERQLFIELREWVGEQAVRIQSTTAALSVLDLLQSFATLAELQGYTRPVLSNQNKTEIVGGRHPVVEQVIGAHNFVPNDTNLDTERRRFGLLTGPNMGGKSTYLRQIGIIQLLAQAGSFVPAQRAELGIVDRIFTRIGGADNLSRGESTFMIEMREAATIIKKASPSSLVLIDEIGRGTATTDGLAIARAVAEYLLDVVRCRTVFATHFHELVSICSELEGSFPISVGVTERDGTIELTHRIEERSALRSYGVEVARLAGLPERLLIRAKDLLDQIEVAAVDADTEKKRDKFPPDKQVKSPAYSERYELACNLLARLEQIDPNQITPLQALVELAKLKSHTST